MRPGPVWDMASAMDEHNTGEGSEDEDDDVIPFNQEIPQLLLKYGHLPPGHKLIPFARTPSGALVKPGDSVVYGFCGKVFYIEHIVQRPEGLTGTYCMGFRLELPSDIELQSSKHTPQPYRLFSQYFHELVAVLLVEEGDIGNIKKDHFLETVDLSEIKMACQVIFTNAEFPTHSHRDAGVDEATHGREFIEDHFPMVCRRKYVKEISKEKGLPVAYQAASLEYTEADAGKGVPEAVKSRRFLADLGFDTRPRRRKRYMFGDLLAGLGCMSEAAKQSGLVLNLALDRWDVACKSLELNGQHGRVLQMPIWDFLHDKVKVDEQSWCAVMHFSPPCQGVSFNNNGTNPEQDAINNSVSLALPDILKKWRPRRMSMEQTNGVLTKHGGFFLRSLISNFQGCKYNVRWKVLKSSDYGSVQMRKRLIVLASCTGESLPSWPEKTHGVGLIPTTTWNERLASIPHGVSHHDIRATAQIKLPQSFRPADGDQTLSKIIDTAGLHCLHPSGTRVHTIREHMAAQGLPNDYEIYYKLIGDWKTQIGNGVPVELGSAILREVVESLQKEDRRQDEFRDEVVYVDGNDTPQQRKVGKVSKRKSSALDEEDDDTCMALRTKTKKRSLREVQAMMMDEQEERDDRESTSLADLPRPVEPCKNREYIMIEDD
ncbi:hypothetical protein LTR62_002264 [Meristemomyces frigidus]|uniref:DNA (cytosine-5-)-methyltransferase n=1 Tax=Meristemomyces frigidus TaxID=1508187 RepID=A0AAN7TFU5_9PEZI|nr:hypothetical protein LTR62_002264 [Meristemomyces frigidus]